MTLTHKIDCITMDTTLPDDAVHITKYTTRYHEHVIDVWFSPSTQTVYSSGRYHRRLTIHEADDNHSSSRFFHTYSRTTKTNVLCRVDRLLSK